MFEDIVPICCLRLTLVRQQIFVQRSTVLKVYAISYDIRVN